jgi:hypothetical protein
MHGGMIETVNAGVREACETFPPTAGLPKIFPAILQVA